jgi:glycosyl transferase family WbsX
MENRSPKGHKIFRCVTPGWDNSLRRARRATVFLGSTLNLFQQWLVETLAKLMKSRNTPHILLINAWNEWAEGNYLEPDQCMTGRIGGGKVMSCSCGYSSAVAMGRVGSAAKRTN